MNYLRNSKTQFWGRRAQLMLGTLVSVLALVVQVTAVGVPRAQAGSDLRLAPNLSFDDDAWADGGVAAVPTRPRQTP